MGIVLLYASLSAYFVKIDDWYAQLVLPKIAASGQLMTIGWSLAYILEIAIIARLVYFREHAKIILPIVILRDIQYNMVYGIFSPSNLRWQDLLS